MILKQFLRKRLWERTPIVCLPSYGELHKAVVRRMRTLVNALPDDFKPDDSLPLEPDYPTPFEALVDEIARYNLRMEILAWRVLYEEVHDEPTH